MHATGNEIERIVGLRNNKITISSRQYPDYIPIRLCCVSFVRMRFLPERDVSKGTARYHGCSNVSPNLGLLADSIRHLACTFTPYSGGLNAFHLPTFFKIILKMFLPARCPISSQTSSSFHTCSYHWTIMENENFNGLEI